MRVAVGIPEEEEIKRARGPVESLDPGSLGDRGHWDDELTVSALIGRAHLDGRPGRHSLRIEPTRRRVPRSTLSEVEGLSGGFRVLPTTRLTQARDFGRLGLFVSQDEGRPLTLENLPATLYPLSTIHQPLPSRWC